MRLLRQRQYDPLSQHRQVLLLTAALNHVMQDIPLPQLETFREGLFAFVEGEAAELCRRIDRTGQLPPEDREALLTLSRRYLRTYQERSGG